MSGTFSIALTALNAQTTAINVVSNNLANLNTTGFKASDVSFYDLVTGSFGSVGSTETGAGLSHVDTTRCFSQGSVAVTSGALDAAIDGDGFFVLHNTQGATLYSRAGNFSLDSSGYLVTGTGERVQGWNSVNGALDTNGAISDILVPLATQRAASATTKISVGANLNAAGVTGETTGSFSSPIQVVDSLGATHSLTINFTKTGANAWGYQVTAPGDDVSGGTAGTPSKISDGTLTFDENGKLKTPSATDAGIQIQFTPANGSAAMDATWNLYGTDGQATLTQFARTSSTSATAQDGVTAADLVKTSIGDGGLIVAQYSDGKDVTLGQLALAKFSNPDSLVDVGDNNYAVGSETSQAAVGVAEGGGRGKVKAGALESSTVDIAKEFTNLIVYQRGYQANSKVITTMDTITQDTINLIR